MFEPLVEAMKHAGARSARRDPFLLGGGLARGRAAAPETEHDVDFLVKPEDAERALQALTDAGMRPERPPEEWLLKAYHDDTLVDLIFAPAGGPVTDELLDRAEEREVMAMRLPVSSLEDVLTTKLLALTEQEPNYASVLEVARTLREQIDVGRSAGANLELTVREGVLHAHRGARHPPRALPSGGVAAHPNELRLEVVELRELLELERAAVVRRRIRAVGDPVRVFVPPAGEAERETLACLGAELGQLPAESTGGRRVEREARWLDARSFHLREKRAGQRDVLFGARQK